MIALVDLIRQRRWLTKVALLVLTCLSISCNSDFQGSALSKDAFAHV